MNDLLKAAESCLKNGNWYAALTLVLTLPDIAGKIEYPDKASGDRYATWFNSFVKEDYLRWLPGNECYALRCAYLHEGSDDTFNQRANQQKSTNRYLFSVPGAAPHFLKAGDILELQVEVFCQDIINGIKTWLTSIEDDQQKQKKLNEFLVVYAIRGFSGNILARG